MKVLKYESYFKVRNGVRNIYHCMGDVCFWCKTLANNSFFFYFHKCWS